MNLKCLKLCVLLFYLPSLLSPTRGDSDFYGPCRHGDHAVVPPGSFLAGQQVAESFIDPLDQSGLAAGSYGPKEFLSLEESLGKGLDRVSLCQAPVRPLPLPEAIAGTSHVPLAGQGGTSVASSADSRGLYDWEVIDGDSPTIGFLLTRPAPEAFGVALELELQRGSLADLSAEVVVDLWKIIATFISSKGSPARVRFSFGETSLELRRLCVSRFTEKIELGLRRGDLLSRRPFFIYSWSRRTIISILRGRDG